MNSSIWIIAILYNLSVIGPSRAGHQRGGNKRFDSTHLDEKSLIHSLLDDYDTRARPVLDSSRPVNVHFGITPVQISDLDEVNQVLSVNVWLQHVWIDERMSWDPTEYNNMTKLRIPQGSIWLPDVVLYNSAEDYTEVMKTKVTIDYMGEVFWGPPIRHRASCQINVKYFPFDIQECTMKFSSWMYDSTQLNLSLISSEVDLENYLPNGEWELIHITAERSSVIYECCTEPYPFVTYKFIIKRRVLYYLFNIVFPCLWLAMLNVMTFYLPPDSGEKITLGITVLLAFSVFMLLVAESMPKTSESVPLIGIYLFVIMSLTSLSIILTIIILQMHHVGPRQHRIPVWIRTFMFDFLAKVLCVRGLVHDFVKQVSLEDGIEKFPRPPKVMSTSDLLYTYAWEIAEKKKSSSPSNGTASGRPKHSRSKLENLILEQIRANNKYRRQKGDHKAIRDEWRLLAIVLDRLFFWIHAIITVSASLGLLLWMPASNVWFQTKKTW